MQPTIPRRAIAQHQRTSHKDLIRHAFVTDKPSSPYYFEAFIRSPPSPLQPGHLHAWQPQSTRNTESSTLET
jgi:hypothetical protein